MVLVCNIFLWLANVAGSLSDLFFFQEGFLLANVAGLSEDYTAIEQPAPQHLTTVIYLFLRGRAAGARAAPARTFALTPGGDTQRKKRMADVIATKAPIPPASLCCASTRHSDQPVPSASAQLAPARHPRHFARAPRASHRIELRARSKGARGAAATPRLGRALRCARGGGQRIPSRARSARGRCARAAHTAASPRVRRLTVAARQWRTARGCADATPTS